MSVGEEFEVSLLMWQGTPWEESEHNRAGAGWGAYNSKGLEGVCEILCCFFCWCKSVAWRADVSAERGHTTAELDTALHLFTNWYLTEADLMSFR